MPADGGTVLGGVSFVIQALNLCYQGYRLAETSRAMPADLRYLSAQLEIEHNRLRSFTAAAGLASGDETPSRTITAQVPLILPILSEVKVVLNKFTGDEEQQPLPSDNANIILGPASQPAELREALRVATMQHPSPMLDETATTFKKKLKWGISEKEKLAQWLSELRHLNDLLHDFLDEHQMQVLRDEQRQTYMELIQMRDSVNDLKTLAEAAYQSRKVSSIRSRWQQTQDTELGDLASFKAFYASLLDTAVKDRKSLLTPASQIQLQAVPSSTRTFQSAQLIALDQARKEVWLTWHYQDPPDIDASTLQLSPIEELTALLKATKPDEFRIPPCLGYCVLRQDQDCKPKVAIIFQRPENIGINTQPTNLLQALTQSPRPSLSHRVALAQNIAKCLLYFHSINWLHKAFRSEAILLFQSEDNVLQLPEPYLTGFDFSRRARWDESSAPKPRHGDLEAYLHPDAQFNRPPLYYRKTFDIYSLGIVLIEIAYWKPIFSIMGIENDFEHSPLATSTIRSRLLDSQCPILTLISAEVGDKFGAAARSCIEGRDAFKVSWTDRETSASTAIRIQHGFNAQVVRMLDEIVV